MPFAFEGVRCRRYNSCLSFPSWFVARRPTLGDSLAQRVAFGAAFFGAVSCVCVLSVPCPFCLFSFALVAALVESPFTVLMASTNPIHRVRREHRSQRGVYRATEVPRDHDTLRTIPMYGNMLQDHTSLSYFDALEEIAAVREAEAKGEFMPEWVPYSESEVCQLCKADFSWASTSKSEVSTAVAYQSRFFLI